ncbi:MAG: hypothetical protein ACKVWV_12240 [Planctomycetota bacterium]
MELFDDILGSDDRDHCPGVAPVLSFHEKDEPEFLAAVGRFARRTVSLSRRAVWHGEWAELDPALLGGRARFAAEPAPGELSERWRAARPIVLRAILRDELDAFADEIDSRDELFGALKEKHGLRDWLAASTADDETFRLLREPAVLHDPARDIERYRVESSVIGPQGKPRRISNLWVKSAWLSTFDGEDSLRLRVSFGRERSDDASRDLVRHRRVADLAERLFPEAQILSSHRTLVPLLERLVGERVLLTQHIAYWNSPDGGALFHHDAFGEDEESGAGLGQLGVCYAQLTGSTAWLAASTDDLAARVQEFAELLGAGEMPWVAQQLFAGRESSLAEFARDRERVVRELGSPGCGALAGLVNRGPEFTAFLADAGHAFVLDPGDVILLPNHGLSRTAMHSVFCSGEETAFSLSLAIRADRVEIAEDVPARVRRSR